MNPNTIILSHATYGATAAATYSFFTKDYKPPAQDRSIDSDVVHNQNGRFKYLYDNGPGFKKWSPFSIRCEEAFAGILEAAAATQYAHIQELWEYPGTLGMTTPEGTYTVHWSQSAMERSFRVFPTMVGDEPEWEVVVQFEEAS